MAVVPPEACVSHTSINASHLDMAGLVGPREEGMEGKEGREGTSDNPMDTLAACQEGAEGPLPRVTARSHTALHLFPAVLFHLLVQTLVFVLMNARRCVMVP